MYIAKKQFIVLWRTNMDVKKEFEKIMGEVDTFALASSVDDIPNVRFLNFVYTNEESILYFQSPKEAPKGKEFEINNNVAFVTFRTKDFGLVRVHHATVKKSKKTIFDVQNLFIEKMPFYKNLIEQHGNGMELYEIHFSKVKVFSGPDNFVEIEL